MKNKFFRKEVFSNPEATAADTNRALLKVQTNVEQAVGDVIKLPLLNGLFINLSLVASQYTDVAHKLGRLPQGYFIVSKNVDSANFKDNIATPLVIGSERVSSSTSFFKLYSSADVTVRLWVF